MKFMGSKAKIAGSIAPIIQECIDRDGINIYIEPFVGGANVIEHIKCKTRIAYDLNKYLIALFKYLQKDGTLPQEISRMEFNEVRKNKSQFPEWYVGCVGFLAGYNGRFFDGGYAGTVTTKTGGKRNYYAEAKRNLEVQVGRLRDVQFIAGDYRGVTPEGAVIYCDPPYKGTKQYDNSRDFDYTAFWRVMEAWSRDNIVLISERAAPVGFNCIWEDSIKRTIDNRSTKNDAERLFISKRINTAHLQPAQQLSLFA